MLEMGATKLSYLATTNETLDGRLVQMSILLAGRLVISDRLREEDFVTEIDQFAAASMRVRAILRLSLYHPASTDSKR